MKPKSKTPKPKPSLIETIVSDLKDKKFGRYSMEVKYETYYPCHDGSNCCDGDMCRCGQIKDAHVESAKRSDVIEPITSKCNDIILAYCIDRIMTMSGMLDKDNWEVNVYRGYYGEETDGVELSLPVLVEVCTRLREIETLSDIDRIKKCLEYEYGYVLPRLQDVRSVSVKDIDIAETNGLNQDYYHKVEMDKVDLYADYQLPRVVCLKNKWAGSTVGDSRYYLIDGYHRLVSANKNKISKIKAIVLE